MATVYAKFPGTYLLHIIGSIGKPLCSVRRKGVDLEILDQQDGVIYKQICHTCLQSVSVSTKTKSKGSISLSDSPATPLQRLKLERCGYSESQIDAMSQKDAMRIINQDGVPPWGGTPDVSNR